MNLAPPTHRDPHIIKMMYTTKEEERKRSWGLTTMFSTELMCFRMRRMSICLSLRMNVSWRRRRHHSVINYWMTMKADRISSQIPFAPQKPNMLSVTMAYVILHYLNTVQSRTQNNTCFVIECFSQTLVISSRNLPPFGNSMLIQKT
jgi:hypothetical protein